MSQQCDLAEDAARLDVDLRGSAVGVGALHDRAATGDDQEEIGRLTLSHEDVAGLGAHRFNQERQGVEVRSEAVREDGQVREFVGTRGDAFGHVVVLPIRLLRETLCTATLRDVAQVLSMPSMVVATRSSKSSTVPS